MNLLVGITLLHEKTKYDVIKIDIDKSIFINMCDLQTAKGAFNVRCNNKGLLVLLEESSSGWHKH